MVICYKRIGSIHSIDAKKIGGLYSGLHRPVVNAHPANELPNVRFDLNSKNKVTGLTLIFDDSLIVEQFEKSR